MDDDWEIRFHCNNCPEILGRVKEDKVFANIVIGENQEPMVVCPKCGSFNYPDKKTEGFICSPSRWVSQSKWWNPMSWNNGYWEFK